MATALAFYGFMYFLPSLAGWLVSYSSGTELPLRRLFVINLLIGWTGFGWLYCWFWLYAKMLAARGAGGVSGSAASATAMTSTPPPTYQPSSYEPQQRQPCGSCGGSGRTTWWSCGGQGGQWRQPVTATDTASWVACGSCMSGKVSCTSCSGSGYGW